MDRRGFTHSTPDGNRGIGKVPPGEGVRKRFPDQNLQRARDFKPLTAEELLKLDEPSRELPAKWQAVYGPVT
jgi:hypothetical protein